MWGILAALALAAATPPNEQVFLLRDSGEPALSVHHQPGRGPSVVYVHGATFPAALSMMYRMDGKSWADDLNARGFDVWSFDFAGYGGSDRSDAMRLASIDRDKVPGRAPDAAHQIERVVRHITKQPGHDRVSVIAHSWGTIPAGMFAGMHPEWVDRLVLFGPVARRSGSERDSDPTSPVRFISEADQWQSFQSGVPTGESSPIAKEVFAPWIKAYLATDPTSEGRTPASVTAPAGFDVDFNDAWNGHLPYDPALIRAPTLIVRGEWDAITRDADAAWLVTAMTSVRGGARDIKLPRGAHRMHLEENRQALFDAVGEFLSRPMIAVIFEVIPRTERRDDYFRLAADLRDALERIDGFVSVERYESLAQPGKYLSLSFWRDEEAVKRWRSFEDHRRAQQAGRNEIFDNYRLRVAEILRDYGLDERAEAPADSLEVHSPGR
jgi:pimeloyl-ACP methyl ester carboxylesterase/heme-degrading monooxygenase HmoA